ncbi:unnamed protein product [Protopolystoma xenopodis]|uniref:Secreted protein n=1 Tax=Protopolystoma xenopodis TaxID=117903 RepID=A0A3S5CGG4_9PLAT|nr:unnamed protein product [Protopolystoma xenopodis]
MRTMWRTRTISLAVHLVFLVVSMAAAALASSKAALVAPEVLNRAALELISGFVHIGTVSQGQAKRTLELGQLFLQLLLRKTILVLLP